ncbi:hypothetical protein EJ07DRAFT_137674 [Lizonia empirigonia]|nr:hypothetical protein EJ07DRAFT_137674 [Lizonia empirigonia]
MDEFFRTVSTMAHYPNTLGLLVASNQVVNKDTGKAIPTVKAVVRDLKRYMKLQNKACDSRLLPLGYDDVITQGGGEKTILDGLSLGDSASAIDFWTCSCYIWAGQSDMLASGYGALIDRLRNNAIPIIMSEYGTNIPNPRLFQETKALYSPRMTQVFSVGCAYDFWQGKNGYGLIELIEKEKKTAEKRETERGTLSIFHDSMNYRENLDATRGIDSSWEGDVIFMVDDVEMNGPCTLVIDRLRAFKLQASSFNAT